MKLSTSLHALLLRNVPVCLVYLRSCLSIFNPSDHTAHWQPWCHRLPRARLLIFASIILPYATTLIVIHFESYWYWWNTTLATCKLPTHWTIRCYVWPMNICATWCDLVHTRHNVIRLEEECWRKATFMVVVSVCYVKIQDYFLFILFLVKLQVGNVQGATLVRMCELSYIRQVLLSCLVPSHILVTCPVPPQVISHTQYFVV